MPFAKSARIELIYDNPRYANAYDFLQATGAGCLPIAM